MKQVKWGLMCLLMLTAATVSAQEPAVSQLSRQVGSFIQAGDNQDADALEELLHAEYRVVLNQLFGDRSLAGKI